MGREFQRMGKAILLKSHWKTVPYREDLEGLDPVSLDWMARQIYFSDNFIWIFKLPLFVSGLGCTGNYEKYSCIRIPIPVQSQ